MNALKSFFKQQQNKYDFSIDEVCSQTGLTHTELNQYFSKNFYHSIEGFYPLINFFDKGIPLKEYEVPLNREKLSLQLTGFINRYYIDIGTRANIELSKKLKGIKVKKGKHPYKETLALKDVWLQEDEELLFEYDSYSVEELMELIPIKMEYEGSQYGYSIFKIPEYNIKTQSRRHHYSAFVDAINLLQQKVSMYVIHHVNEGKIECSPVCLNKKELEQYRKSIHDKIITLCDNQ